MCHNPLFPPPAPDCFINPLESTLKSIEFFISHCDLNARRNVCRGAKSGGENRDKIRFLSFQLSLNLSEDFLMQKDRFEQTQKASIRLNIVYAPSKLQHK